MSAGGVVSFGEIPCAVCEERAASWQHDLDETQSRFRVHGQGHVWGSPTPLCDICDEAVVRGDVDALVSRDPRSTELSDEDLVQQIRNGHEALVRASVRRERFAEATPPGWKDAVAHGFTPMERFTGALHLVDGWPDEHRRSVTAHDPGDADRVPHGRHWFIRSPWPSVDLESLWHLVIHTVESAPVSGDEAATWNVRHSEVATVRELLSLDELAIVEGIERLP